MIRRASALVVLCLAGCAHQGTPAPPTAAGRLLAVQDFELRGRLGVRTATDGFNGSLRWRQQGEALNLLIFGPLGVGRTELRGSLDGVEIVDGKGHRAFFADPEVAFLENFGWSLPLGALRYWVLGLPEPGAPVRAAVYEGDAGGRRLRSWRQGGWSVAVTQYGDYDGWVVPRKITLASGATTIKLVAANWEIAAPAD